MSALRTGAPRQIFTVAMESFVFTYPLVLMELIRQQITSTRVAGDLLAPMNQFAHMREPSMAPFTPVVTPNPDTLYSSAWLDLSAGPVMLSIPEIVDRYFVIPVYDAWTNVLASPGTRTSGGAAADLALAGPRSRMKEIPDLTVVNAPTSIVWITARIQVNGPADYEAIHRLQRALRLTPMNRPKRRRTATTSSPGPLSARQLSPPASRLARMDHQSYFRTVARLLTANRPRPEDAPVIARMRDVGLLDRRPETPIIEPQISRAIARGMSAGLAQIEETGRNPPVIIRNNWIFRQELQSHSDDYYLRRAAAAWTGLGALPPAEGVTPTTRQDARGLPLSGERSYTLRFDAGTTPPVHGFWSLTAQEPESFFVREHRHDVLRSPRGLHYEMDGSLYVHLQHDPPARTGVNWLRTPRGPFSLVLRLYWPRHEVLTGDWWPPAVIRV